MLGQDAFEKLHTAPSGGATKLEAWLDEPDLPLEATGVVQPPTSRRPCWSPAEPTEFRSEPTEPVENLEDDEDEDTEELLCDEDDEEFLETAPTPVAPIREDAKASTSDTTKNAQDAVESSISEAIAEQKETKSQIQEEQQKETKSEIQEEKQEETKSEIQEVSGLETKDAGESVKPVKTKAKSKAKCKGKPGPTAPMAAGPKGPTTGPKGPAAGATTAEAKAAPVASSVSSVPRLRRSEDFTDSRKDVREAMIFDSPELPTHLRRSNSLDAVLSLNDELFDGEVKLQVYHLAKAVKAIGLPIYHTAVEVYGLEHYFCLDGVQVCLPQGYGQGVHKIAVTLGRTRLSSSRVGEIATVESPQADDKKGERGNRPLRTKVSTKEFSKYDIDPERIERGEDSRTTVMVRNVAGNNARKEFLNLMEKFGLSDRFTFFYMPCKEHRNVLAGFAFVNFISPLDVHKLFVMVKNGAWREVMSKSQTKAPGVSYARFQGHEELVEHFSSSAVLHEQDPEKRPIFRPDAAAKAAKEKQKNGSKKESSPLPKVSNGAPGLMNGMNGMNGHGNAWMSLLTSDELKEASQKIMSTPPAYVKSSLMEAPEDAMDAAPPQMGA